MARVAVILLICQALFPAHTFSPDNLHVFSLLPFEDAAELLLKPTTAKSLHRWQDVAAKVYRIDFSVTKPKAESTGELTLENYLILFRVTQNPLPNVLI